MRWVRRLLIGLAVLVAVIVLVPTGIVGGLIAWVKLSPQPTEGTFAIPGMDAPVDLVWDADAVPHIFAGSMRDAYRVLGWVHARDRLWEMESNRRIGQGRLSEIIGSQGLGYDKEMRVLGLYRLAERNYGTLDPDTRGDIDAYTAGVNAYLTHRTAPLPLEFQLLAIKPEPWRPADSLVWGRLMALQLSGNYYEEAARAALAKQVPADVFKDFFPETPPPGPVTLAGLGAVDWAQFAAHMPPTLGPNHASNEWVVDGTLTKTGKPLLANDPHLGLSAPILWYMARIVTPEGSIAGVTVPGVPFHLLGHNGHFAWGLTTTGGDVQDLFVEDTASGVPGKYRTPDGPADFMTRDEVIKVRFSEDIHLTVRETRHGPVLSDVDSELAAAAGPNTVVALSFIGLDPADTTTAAVRGISRAHDQGSFTAAMKLWETPEQNLVYADIDGNIGFASVGVLPLRKRPTDDFPAPEFSGAADWLGVTDFTQLPQSYNPPAHRFVNANNQVVPDDFWTYIGRRYESPFRAARINDMLDAAKRPFTTEDFVHMQLDLKAQDATLLLPRLLRAHSAGAMGKRALALLGKWDAVMDRNRAEPLIYTAWVYRLEHALIVERLGAGARPFSYDPYLITRLLDHEPGGPEQAASVLDRTLDDTLTALAKAYGGDMSEWHWGAAHRAGLKSQIFGAIPVLGRLFDLGFPVSGGDETVSRAGIGRNDGVHFPDVHGSGYRGVFDLSDLSQSRFIIATGQSGDPLSPHYGDMVERWRTGRSITLTGTAEEVAKTGLGRMIFAP